MHSTISLRWFETIKTNLEILPYKQERNLFDEYFLYNVSTVYSHIEELPNKPCNVGLLSC